MGSARLGGKIDSHYQQRFHQLVNRDLNMAGAVALIWAAMALGYQLKDSR